MANENTKLKTSIFAFIALLTTLGFIIAGFIWVHIEAKKSTLPHHAISTTALDNKVNKLQLQITRQQQILLDLQTKIHKLETFAIHAKNLHYLH